MTLLTRALLPVQAACCVSHTGEAYLLTHNLAAAEQHLAALNRICGVVCAEYKDLAREIAEYKKKR